MMEMLPHVQGYVALGNSNDVNSNRKKVHLDIRKKVTLVLFSKRFLKK